MIQHTPGFACVLNTRTVQRHWWLGVPYLGRGGQGPCLCWARPWQSAYRRMQVNQVMMSAFVLMRMSSAVGSLCKGGADELLVCPGRAVSGAESGPYPATAHSVAASLVEQPAVRSTRHSAQRAAERPEYGAQDVCSVGNEHEIFRDSRQVAAAQHSPLQPTF